MTTLAFDVLWRDRGAAAGLKNLGTQADQAHAKMSKFSGQTGKGLAGLSSAAGKFGIAGGLLAVGIGAAVKAAADFDSAMSRVAASGADARANLTELRAAAIKAGADTAFSATEAADGIEALVKAGVSAKDILGGGLKGALDLAAAGGLNVGDAAETAAMAMNQFGLKGKDVTHIADLMAQGAGVAAGEVSDMAAALKQSGLVANQFGLNIDETTQALALFAKSGLIGSDAGTSFKTMLTSLYAPAGAGAAALEELGVSAYDASGKIKPIGVLTDQLKKKLDALSTGDRNKAMRNIFGSDAIRAGTILLKDGSKGLADMATEFGKFGSASEVAKAKMNNLKGDIEQFKGSLETAMIGLGEGAQGPLRSFVKGATDAVNAFNGLSDGAKSTVLGIGAGAAGLLLTAAALGKLAVAASEAKVAFAALGITAKRAIIGIPAIGIALAAVGAAVSHFVGQQAMAQQATMDFSSAFEAMEGSVTSATAALNENVRATAFKTLQDRGAVDSAKALGLGLNVITDAALGNQFAMDLARRAIADAMGTKSQKDAMALGRALNLTAEAAKAGMQAEQDRRSAMTGGAAATDAAKQAADEHAAALEDEATALAKAADDAVVLANSLLQLSGSHIGVEAAIDAATKAAKDNGKTLDLNTAKGRANQTALNGIASATLQYTNSLVKAQAPADEIVAANERGRSSFIKSARAMGASAKQARSMADALFTIPGNVKSQVVVAGGKISVKQAKDLNSALKKLPKEQRSKIVTIANTKGATAAWKEIAKVKNKSVIAKATGKGVNTVKEIDAAIKKLKSKAVRAQANTAGKGAVNALDNAIKALKSRRVHASATTSGKGGVDSLRNALGGLKSKTVYATIISRKMKADGGFIDPVSRASGGMVPGRGGPREDNIAGFDRATRVQTAWVSAREFVVNAAQTKANRAQIETINAGGRWDLVPRRAGGGMVGRGDYVSANSRGGVTVIDNRTYNIPNYVGSYPDLVKALTVLDRQGALRKFRFGQ